MGDYYSGDGMDPGSSGSSEDREGNSKDKGTATARKRARPSTAKDKITGSSGTSEGKGEDKGTAEPNTNDKGKDKGTSRQGQGVVVEMKKSKLMELYICVKDRRLPDGFSRWGFNGLMENRSFCGAGRPLGVPKASKK